jgi:hypothetical protein
VLPSIGYWGRVKKCSVQCYEALLAPPLFDALDDGFVGFIGEIGRVRDVGETHGGM